MVPEKKHHVRDVSLADAKGCRAFRGVDGDPVDDHLVHQALDPCLLFGVDTHAFVLDTAMQRRCRGNAAPWRAIEKRRWPTKS